MSNQISGMDFDVMVGDLLVHVESLAATITDNRKAIQNRGVPNGHVNGDVSCAGEMELDSRNFNLIIEAAKAAGSFRDLEPFDVICVADLGDQRQRQELFGCLLMVSDLLNIDSKGGDKTTHKLPFQVTSPDFVRINGVPYLSDRNTEGL